MIVLDSLSASHQMDENSAEMRFLLTEMVHAAQATNLAVVTIHHPTKQRADESAKITLRRVRGSSVIGQLCRVVWGLWQPDPQEEVVRVEQIKNNFARTAPQAFGFKWEENPDRIEFCEAPEEPQVGRPISQRSLAEEVLEALLSRGPKTYAELKTEALAQGINESTYERARRNLKLRKVEIRTDGKPIVAWALPTKRER